jgi:hypothetical protein
MSQVPAGSLREDNQSAMSRRITKALEKSDKAQDKAWEAFTLAKEIDVKIEHNSEKIDVMRDENSIQHAAVRVDIQSLTGHMIGANQQKANNKIKYITWGVGLISTIAMFTISAIFLT